MKKYFTFPLLIILSFFVLSCSLMKTRTVENSMKFVVMGNSNPQSPFSWTTEKLSRVVENINRENPVFIIHTGNIVHGGSDWMGINRGDLQRQFDGFYSVFRGLDAILYTVPGEKDFYNKSSDVYEKNTGRKADYSFNYGNLHFVVLNTGNKDSYGREDNQIKWLSRDLEEYKNSRGIFVISHRPLYREPVKRGKAGKTDGQSELHELFKKYPVRVVLSGKYSKFQEKELDGISYVAAGCGGYGDGKRYRRYSQYYVVDYNGSDFSIKGRTVLY